VDLKVGGSLSFFCLVLEIKVGMEILAEILIAMLVP